MESLNQGCFCMAVDAVAVRAAIAAALGAHGLPGELADSHPHLFASLPVYVSPKHIAQVECVVSAMEEVVALADYRSAALHWAPEIARFDPHSPGGLLGLDFHLTASGPKLIEINTNPGGALLNALLGEAQRTCMPDIVRSPIDPTGAVEHVLQVMLDEWRLQRGDRTLAFVAIVDERPETQYLYPEFLLFRQLLVSSGIDAVVCDSRELTLKGGRLSHGERSVDMVYNRLTDFSLAQPEHKSIRTAYLAGEVVVSPHPRAHALYADKRNLVLLGDQEFLLHAGASQAVARILSETVPRTVLISDDNRDALWDRRRDLFFKPAAGFGSKASYRGDKLTRRVWGEIARESYIAQDVVTPSARHMSADSAPFKADIRCYAYRGRPLLYAARLYQGQTTNFRTPGGGFAPVLTSEP
jgi:hypothetical protein